MTSISQTNSGGQEKNFAVQVNTDFKITRPYREPIVFFEDRVRYGKPCPPEDSEVHKWMLGHTLTGISLNLTFEQVYGIIRKYSNRTDDNPKYRYAYKGGQRTCRLEIWEIWEKYEHIIPRTLAPRRSGSPIPYPSRIGAEGAETPVFERRVIERWDIASTTPSREFYNRKDERYELIALKQQVQLYFQARFRPDEPVPVKYARQSQPCVQTRDEWMFHPEWIIKRGQAGFEGVWTTANAALSAREEHVMRWNSVVCEDDNSPMEEQWAVYLKSGLPIKTITWSGGKSLHAIVIIGECKDGCEYRGKAEAVYRHLENLGLKMDWGCRNPNRLTRVGGALRNGKSQTLLWIGRRGEIEWQKAKTTTKGQTNEQ